MSTSMHKLYYLNDSAIGSANAMLIDPSTPGDVQICGTISLTPFTTAFMSMHVNNRPYP